MDALMRKIMNPMRLERELRLQLDREDSAPLHADEPPVQERAAFDNVLASTRISPPTLITLADQQRERERILEPGAPEPAGGPYKMLRTQVLRRLVQINAN